MRGWGREVCIYPETLKQQQVSWSSGYQRFQEAILIYPWRLLSIHLFFILNITVSFIRLIDGCSSVAAAARGKRTVGKKGKQNQMSPFFTLAQGWWYWRKVMAKICRRARTGWGQPAVNLGWKRIPVPGTGPAWGVRKPFPPWQSVVPRPGTVPVPCLRPWLSGEHSTRRMGSGNESPPPCSPDAARSLDCRLLKVTF